MTNAQTTMTTKTNRYLRALVVLAMLASLLAVLAVRPAHATSIFTVNLTSDEADASVTDGLCDVSPLTSGSQCTLRAAIHQADFTLGADTINFNVPAALRDPNTGVATIKPQSALPVITQTVTIDGYTQPGASPNTKTVGNDAVLKIQLDGTNMPNDNGLEINTSDGSVIRGLVINHFGDGIFIHGDSVANRIEGNFVGTDPTGTLDRGNNFDGVGIVDGPSETVIGGSTPDKRNVLSGNDDGGIFMGRSNVNVIRGNYIGTDKGGTRDLGNTDGGVFIQNASGTTVGGNTSASRNVISGNDSDGITLLGSQSAKVLGNRIGTTAGGTEALGNADNGVFLSGSATLVGDGTAAGSNTIAFNGRDGVNVDGSSTGNEISRNSVFSNAGLGIDLVGPGENAFTTSIPTKNDPGDTDTGANNLQNKPVVSSARTGSLKTTFKGRLDSNHDQTFTVEFFSNPSNTNEGKKFIGETTVKTSVDGLASFTFSPSAKVAAGQTITATATNTTTHDTSEFSAPRTVATA